MSTQYLPLVSGPIEGGMINWRPVSMATGEGIQGGFSGRFFTIGTDGYATICTNSSTTISGWIESGTILAAANTADGMIVRPGCMFDGRAVFRMPCSGAAFTQALVGDLCDPVVTSLIQYAAIGTHSNDLLRIVGGYAGATAATSYVDVVMNQAEFLAAS